MKNLLLLLALIISTFGLMNAQDSITFCPNGIEANESNTMLNVFPNPTEGSLQIIYASTTECPPDGWGGMLIISIKNLSNKTVYSETILVFEGEYNKTIDLSSQEKGIYSIELVAGKQKKVKRAVLK